MKGVRSGLLNAGLCLALAACGGGESAGEEADATSDASAGDFDCSAVTEDLLVRVGIGYQLVKQIDPERNLETMEATGGLPDPGAFRDMAEVMEGMDTSEMELLQFLPPEELAAQLRQLATLLEEALAQRDYPADPAWETLRGFVMQSAPRQQMSLGYLLDEAGCRR
jgi:hypothetical protein